MQHERSDCCQLTVGTTAIDANSRAISDSVVSGINGRDNIVCRVIWRSAGEIADDACTVQWRLLKNSNAVTAGSEAVVVEDCDRHARGWVRANRLHCVRCAGDSNGGEGWIKGAKTRKGWRRRR